MDRSGWRKCRVLGAEGRGDCVAREGISVRRGPVVKRRQIAGPETISDLRTQPVSSGSGDGILPWAVKCCSFWAQNLQQTARTGATLPGTPGLSWSAGILPAHGGLRVAAGETPAFQGGLLGVREFWPGSLSTAPCRKLCPFDGPKRGAHKTVPAAWPTRQGAHKRAALPLPKSHEPRQGLGRVAVGFNPRARYRKTRSRPEGAASCGDRAPSGRKPICSRPRFRGSKPTATPPHAFGVGLRAVDAIWLTTRPAARGCGGNCFCTI